jgi:hypothetical protein
MVDTVETIITPATSYDLLTLDELKITLGIPTTDTTNDIQMAQWITRASDTVSVKCNRIFATETLSELWTGLSSNRIYLSHWPTKASDIEGVESPQGTPIDPSDWLLEERSGKLELIGSFATAAPQPILVTYTGGFDLPTDPRPSLQALKQATELVIWEMRALAMRMQTSGIRSISHKEARVMFYDPLAFFKAAASAGGAMGAIDALLMHYVRFQV